MAMISLQAPGGTRGGAKQALEFWRRQHLEIWFTVAWLPVAIVSLLGQRSVPFLTAWSVSASAYAAYLWRVGWTPWQMPAYEITVGKRGKTVGDSEAIAVYRFLRSRGSRRQGGLLTLSAALTPWIFFAATMLLNLEPIGHLKGKTMPVWLGLLLGLGDGIRAGTLAMRHWSSAVLGRWDEIVTDNSGPEADDYRAPN